MLNRIWPPGFGFFYSQWWLHARRYNFAQKKRVSLSQVRHTDLWKKNAVQTGRKPNKHLHRQPTAQNGWKKNQSGNITATLQIFYCFEPLVREKRWTEPSRGYVSRKLIRYVKSHLSRCLWEKKRSSHTPSFLWIFKNPCKVSSEKINKKRETLSV